MLLAFFKPSRFFLKGKMRQDKNHTFFSCLTLPLRKNLLGLKRKASYISFAFILQAFQVGKQFAIQLILYLLNIF